MGSYGYHIKLPNDKPETLLKGLKMLSKQKYISRRHNFDSIYNGSHYTSSSKDYLVCFDGIIQPEIFSESHLQKLIEGRHEDFMHETIEYWKELNLNYINLGEL